MTGPSTDAGISRRGFLFPSQDDKDTAGEFTAFAITDACLTKSGVDCRLCDDACLPRALRFRPVVGGQYVPSIDAELCTACGDCAAICPLSAIAEVRQ